MPSATATRFLTRDIVVDINTGPGAGVALSTPFGVAATDILTATAHGLGAEDQVEFTALTGGTGLTVLTSYYIINPTANTFQLSLTKGGAAINFTTDITAGSIRLTTWAEIRGLNSLDHSPETERTDASGFDSGGRAEHLVVQRGDKFTLSGFKLVDSVDGAGDRGQVAVEASGRLTGTAAEEQYRITIPGVTADVYTFIASAEVKVLGGGHNAIAEWSAELEVTGAVTVT